MLIPGPGHEVRESSATEGWFLWAYDGSGVPMYCRVRREADGSFTPLVETDNTTLLAQVAQGGESNFIPDGQPVSREPLSDALWR